KLSFSEGLVAATAARASCWNGRHSSWRGGRREGKSAFPALSIRAALPCAGIAGAASVTGVSNFSPTNAASEVRAELERTASLFAREYPSWHLEVFDSIDSTSAEARRRTEDASRRDPLILMALHQTAGRGQRDRRWTTPPGKALLFTAAIPYERLARGHSGIGEPHDFYPLSLWPLLVSLGISLRLRLFGWEAKLKWPNDILIDGRKVCGVLCEATNRTLLVGVGLNLTQDANDFASVEHGTNPPGSLLTSPMDGNANNIEMPQVIPSIVQCVATVLEAPWPEQRMLGYYRSWCDTIGRKVAYTQDCGAVVRGTAESILDDGRLVIRTDDGDAIPISNPFGEGTIG
ncbi:MAG TPA: biotin--[acetyl-CoA-carboxylase] ligase, partial [Candidatus Sumerlaeota bacterium]|nr:biotin--[acetyl-CoA-carboxylase] ligase [Candidatus Sumerlaeota bacterium]